MSLKGIWKGEAIFPSEANEQGRDIAVSILLVISHHDLLGDLRGTLSYDPTDSGIEESAQIIGEVKTNQILFVQLLSHFYYMQEDRKPGVANTPHPEVLYEGMFMERDYLLGSWVQNKTYRLVDERVIAIPERKGGWWLKKIRGA